MMYGVYARGTKRGEYEDRKLRDLQKLAFCIVFMNTRMFSMAEIIDISWRLDNKTIIYPGDPTFDISQINSISKDGYSVQRISMGTHTGTHIDVPRHFVENGMDAYSIPLDVLIGEVLVVDARGYREISFSVLEELGKIEEIRKHKRILLRTDNEKLLGQTFSDSYIGITPDLAKFIKRETNIRLIGIDYISIENPGDGNFIAHRVFLTDDPVVYILEGLDLRSVGAGIYELMCLPLPIYNGDGAPVRAILIKEEILNI